MTRSWSPADVRPATRQSRWASAARSTGTPSAVWYTSSPVNAGSPGPTLLPKCLTRSICPAATTFSANATPSVSRSLANRPGLTARLTWGGSNEHCCTQLASMPVSSSPVRTVRTNSPLGTRPRAAANACSWVIAPSLRQKLGHQLADHVVVHVLVHELLFQLALLVEHHHQRRAVDLQLRLPGLRLLVEDQIGHRRILFLEELRHLV